MLILLTLLLGIGILVYLYFTWTYDYWEKKCIHGPRPKFLVGTLPNSILQNRNVTYDLDDIYREYKGYKYVGIFQNRSPQLLIINPELVKDILIRNFSNFHDNEFSDMMDKNSDPLLALNPFFIGGQEWKDRRAEISPALSTNRIKAMCPIIDDVCQRLAKYIQTEIDNKSDGIEAKEMSAKYTTDVVSSCIYAVDAGSFTKDKSEIREMGSKILEPTFRTIVYFIMIYIFPFLKKYFKVSFISKEVEEFFTNLMKDAINYRETNKIDRQDYLSYLLQLRDRKGLSELDMAAHSVSFFIDGFETSSVLLAHCFYELSINKKIQDKLRKEIRVAKNSDNKIDYDKLNELLYLDQVIYETMRLHPPIPIISRKCTETYVLPEQSGVNPTVDIQTQINFSIHSIQRDPEYYTSSDEFIPERFNPEFGGVKSFRDKGVLFPFGDGPRICLGIKFAMAQTKAAIAEIIDKFELTKSSKTQLPLVIEPKHFLNIKVGGLWVNYKNI